MCTKMEGKTGFFRDSRDPTRGTPRNRLVNIIAIMTTFLRPQKFLVLQDRERGSRRRPVHELDSHFGTVWSEPV